MLVVHCQAEGFSRWQQLPETHIVQSRTLLQPLVPSLHFPLPALALPALATSLCARAANPQPKHCAKNTNLVPEIRAVPEGQHHAAERAAGPARCARCCCAAQCAAAEVRQRQQRRLEGRGRSLGKC